MIYKDARKLEEDIKYFCGTRGESLCFFGAGLVCNNILEWFKKSHFLLPFSICDNDKKKHGTMVEGIPVMSFDQAVKLHPNLRVLITSTSYGNEIEKFLLEYLPSEHILNIKTYDQQKTRWDFIRGFMRSNENFITYSKELREGTSEHWQLMSPHNIPSQAQEVISKYNNYLNQWKNGENITIPVDDFFVKKRSDLEFYQLSSEDTDAPDRSVKLQDFMAQEKYNHCYKIRDHHLVMLQEKKISYVGDQQGRVHDVTQFYHYLQKKNIPFLYVQLPSKISPIDTDLPKDTICVRNQEASAFVEGLKKNKVPCYDYRQELIEDGVDFLSLFYRTDLHWTNQAAFDATEKICRQISKYIDMDFDTYFFDPSNYYRVLYQKIFLGAFSDFTGILYGGLDDFTLLLPKFETLYQWEVPYKGYIKKGEAKVALTFPLHLDWHYYKVNPYVVNSLGSDGYTVIKNLKAKTNKKIFFIHDSFTMPISQFIAAHFAELHFFDLRKKLVKKDLFSLIDQILPDIIVMEYFVGEFYHKDITNVNPYEV